MLSFNKSILETFHLEIEEQILLNIKISDIKDDCIKYFILTFHAHLKYLQILLRHYELWLSFF